jgi:hypothetical protein
MKSLKLCLIAVGFLAAPSTFANDGHIKNGKSDKAEKNLYNPNLSCMDRALLQVEVGTNIAYQTMLGCGVAPECTIAYNNTINTVYAYIENAYEECMGVGHAFSADHPTESPLYKALQSK